MTKLYSFQHWCFFLALSVALPMESVLGQEDDAVCDDPIGAVLAAMECMKVEDAECAAAGYPPGGFQKIRNGIYDDDGAFTDRSVATWQGIFALADISLVTWNETNVVDQPNMASFHYNETTVMTDGQVFGLEPSTEYPFSQTYLQTEHAFVTVDGECQIILWNQTGIDEEQVIVDTAFADLVAVPEIYCLFNPGECAGTATPTVGSGEDDLADTIAASNGEATDAPTASPEDNGCAPLSLWLSSSLVFAVSMHFGFP